MTNTQPLPHLPQEASQLPAFAPIVPPTSPHGAYNMLPAHLRHSDHVEPVDILSLFLTKSLLQTMAANTNAYAAKQLEESRQSGESGGRKWEEVTPEELSLWLGIVLYMGVCSAPAVKDYWSRDDSLTAIHPIRDYMSQTRFEQIKKYYHVAALDAPTHAATGRCLWYSKVDPLLDQLRYSYQQYRMPSTHTATDECMIRAIGRS